MDSPSIGLSKGHFIKIAQAFDLTPSVTACAVTPPPLPVGEGEGYNLGNALDPPVASFVGNRGLQTWNAYGIQNVP